MGTADKYNLMWNDFENNFCKSIKTLRFDEDFYDVTLSVGPKQIKAHKLILSSCSSFFKTVLKENPHQHPLLYLRNVSYQTLQAIMEFMYLGSVNLDQEDLPAFLAVTEELGVHGLSGGSTNDEPKDRRTLTGGVKRGKAPVTEDDVEARLHEEARRIDRDGYGSQSKKARLEMEPDILHVEEPEVKQELDPIGEEEDEDCVEDVTPPPPLPSHQLSLPPRLNGPHPQYQIAEDDQLYEDDQYEYADFSAGGAVDNSRLGNDIDAHFGEAPYHSLTQTEGGVLCSLCWKVYTSKRNARRHVRLQHATVTCKVCGKMSDCIKAHKQHLCSPLMQ